jgi:hypothetical protein
MLSKAEVQYLQGHKEVSKSYERKLKCIIKKKIDVLQKELPLLSKLFTDNFKGFSYDFVNVNAGPPSLITEQKKQDLNEYYPKTFEVKRATRYSNLGSGDAKTKVDKDVKYQNFG